MPQKIGLPKVKEERKTKEGISVDEQKVGRTNGPLYQHFSAKH